MKLNQHKLHEKTDSDLISLESYCDKFGMVEYLPELKNEINRRINKLRV